MLIQIAKESFVRLEEIVQIEGKLNGTRIYLKDNNTIEVATKIEDIISNIFKVEDALKNRRISNEQNNNG